LASGEPSHQKEAADWLHELDQQFPPESVAAQDSKPVSNSDKKTAAGKAAKD
jgi:hypothetical protein